LKIQQLSQSKNFDALPSNKGVSLSKAKRDDYMKLIETPGPGQYDLSSKHTFKSPIL
jgi:hypothetical protein